MAMEGTPTQATTAGMPTQALTRQWTLERARPTPGVPLTREVSTQAPTAVV